MTDPNDNDEWLEGLPLSGLQRYKPALSKVPDPDELAGWLGVAREINVPPRKVIQAITELDQLAESMLPAKHLISLISDGDCELAEKLFGLDQPTNVLRLRTAVERAWRVAWRFADAYCDFVEDSKDAKSIAGMIEKSLAEMSDDIRVGGLILDRWRCVKNPEHYTQANETLSVLGDLSEILNTWSNDSKKQLTNAILPDRFLLLRLAEIYVVNFGRRAPLHDTKRAAGNRDAPDQKFTAFLEVALRCAEWPTAMASRDNALRSINQTQSYFSDKLDFLHMVVHDKTERYQITYGSLPTMGLLGNLRAYEDDVL